MNDTCVLETADGSKTLFSERYGEGFGSRRGALTESRYVFLEGSGVAQRLADGGAARVLEVGFGTGLTFFLTAEACLAHPGAQLHYTALERTLLPVETLRTLGYDAHLKAAVPPAYARWREGLLEAPPPGRYTFDFKGATLELLIGEATTQILPDGHYGAVYQDAFSPAVNPELWSEAFLERLYRALQAGGTLTSYCVKGAVRRRLTALGFEVHKRPGPPGGKREVLLARKPVTPPEPPEAEAPP